jgi:bifunctional DNA-binding transcriptional regulator/antitoxin component of YhaV-PrlF toxin-antitoxin module
MVKYGDPRHMLLILKSIREKLNKNDGDEIEVTVEPDDKKREMKIPKDLQKQLYKNTKLME